MTGAEEEEVWKDDETQHKEGWLTGVDSLPSSPTLKSTANGGLGTLVGFELKDNHLLPQENTLVSFNILHIFLSSCFTPFSFWRTNDCSYICNTGSLEAMILGQISYLDCIVFLVFLAPQLLFRVNIFEVLICIIQALPFFCEDLCLNFFSLATYLLTKS